MPTRTFGLPERFADEHPPSSCAAQKRVHPAKAYPRFMNHRNPEPAKLRTPVAVGLSFQRLDPVVCSVDRSRCDRVIMVCEDAQAYPASVLAMTCDGRITEASAPAIQPVFAFLSNETCAPERVDSNEILANTAAASRAERVVDETRGHGSHSSRCSMA